MPETKKISIVTPTFNSAPTLRETIESVLAQDYKNWEHIVMDGGSTDGTVDILRSYPHLKWVSEKDKGHYHAMNKGIERATGDVIAILNGDDCYREGALSKVAEAFQKNPAWDGLFGDIVYVDGQGAEIFRRHEAAYDYDVLRFGNVCYVIHPTLFVKKSVYDRLGAYQYEKFLNCCDVDFILRLGKAGMRIGHIPHALANYRLHEHGQSADRRVAENMDSRISRDSQRTRFPRWCDRQAARDFRQSETSATKTHLPRQIRSCFRKVISQKTHAREDNFLFEHWRR